MRNGVPVLAVVGPSRCGKDTSGEWLRDNTCLRFQAGCSLTVLPWVARRLGVSEGEAWETRHQHRMEWYHLCNEYRKDDPARIIRECLTHSDIVVGVRDQIELLTAREEGLLDLIVWIDRPVPADPTMKFNMDDADVIITNYSSHNGLYFKLRRLAAALGVLRENR